LADAPFGDTPFLETPTPDAGVADLPPWQPLTR
jgi:hypothetical protein